MGSDLADRESAALRFVCLPADRLASARAEGLDLGTVELFETLAAARRARRRGERLLVVSGVPAGAALAPPEALPNLAPYRKPKAVEAAGGLVVRPGVEGPEVLLIYRKGAWDLPKGHRDPGETLAACAKREVCEELGIASVERLDEAGRTVHGYPLGDRYAVKHTQWYFMRTEARHFQPAADEGIERVAWVAWCEAKAQLGYETLRALLDRCDGALPLHATRLPHA